MGLYEGFLKQTSKSLTAELYRADDLIIEENEDVIKALKRLPPQASYDRVYRIRRAFQCSTVHQLLPKDQWTKPEEVRLYIYIYISNPPPLNRSRGSICIF